MLARTVSIFKWCALFIATVQLTACGEAPAPQAPMLPSVIVNTANTKDDGRIPSSKSAFPFVLRLCMVSNHLLVVKVIGSKSMLSMPDICMYCVFKLWITAEALEIIKQ